MEQKMLLPIMIVVLVGGFLIGYYAASIGGGAAARTGQTAQAQSEELPEVRGSAILTGTALESDFVIATTFVESTVGYLESMGTNEITINRNDKTVTLPLYNTTVLALANGRESVAPFDYPKPGDYVNVRTVTNTKTKQLVSTSVAVLKKVS